MKKLVAAAAVIALAATGCGSPVPVYGVPCTSRQFDGGTNGCLGDCNALLDDGGSAGPGTPRTVATHPTAEPREVKQAESRDEVFRRFEVKQAPRPAYVVWELTLPAITLRALRLTRREGAGR